MAFEGLELDFARDGKTTSAIAVRLTAPYRDAKAHLRVLRGNPYGGFAGAPTLDRQVVFQTHVRLKNIAAPDDGPPGSVALSTWSGTLTPSDWDGGCEKALYTVHAAMRPRGSPALRGGHRRRVFVLLLRWPCLSSVHLARSGRSTVERRRTVERDLPLMRNAVWASRQGPFGRDRTRTHLLAPAPKVGRCGKPVALDQRTATPRLAPSPA